MRFWTFDTTIGNFFLDFAWLGVLLIIAMYLRTTVPLFRRYLIPANLIAGAIGLTVGANGLGLIDLTTDRMGAYVYHFLALLFIALALRTPQKKVGLSSVKTGMLFLMTYLVQGIIGLLIALLLVYTIMPELFVGIGFLPPLAFGMNPGIAFSIGESWEPFGFESGGIVGLTFSAFGFLAAYTTGLWAVRRGINQNEATFLKAGEDFPEDLKSGFVSEQSPQQPGKLTTTSEALESLSFHLGLVGIVYVATYGLLKLFEAGLFAIGADNEVHTLWSFHFIFAAIVALFGRKVIDATRISFAVDDVTMTRISNFFMDFMIVASVTAISLVVVVQYWLPLLLISIMVVLATWWFTRRFCYSAFSSYKLERFTAVYGNMTGTLQSGLILLRILDSGMKTPVSFNLVYGSGLALILGFPLLLLINAPVHYFADVITGFWMVLGAMIIYLLLLYIAWKVLEQKNSS